MKTIGISIDGVIRDFYTEFDKQYRKAFIHNPSLVEMTKDMQLKEQSVEELDDLDKRIELKEKELITLPLNSFDLSNHYKFEETVAMDGETILSPQEALKEFMFQKFPFNIFGKAEEYRGACEAFNRIQAHGIQNNLYKTKLLTSYGGQILTATWHFLATHNCRMRSFEFVQEDYEKWDHCDILIDCVPEVIQDIPDGKTIIKIEHPFNQWDGAEHSFKSLSEITPKFIEELLVGKKSS
ncbi:MAG: hypothetical protein AABY15_06015 [Nanoarchaeota archaeon]